MVKNVGWGDWILSFKLEAFCLLFDQIHVLNKANAAWRAPFFYEREYLRWAVFLTGAEDHNDIRFFIEILALLARIVEIFLPVRVAWVIVAKVIDHIWLLGWARDESRSARLHHHEVAVVWNASVILICQQWVDDLVLENVERQKLFVIVRGLDNIRQCRFSSFFVLFVGDREGKIVEVATVDF